MILTWRLFSDCRTEAAALRVAARHFKRADLSVVILKAAPDREGSYIVVAETEHPTQSWAEHVLQTLDRAQAVAHGWTLNGSILEEIDTWSNESTIAGITAVHVMSRP